MRVVHLVSKDGIHMDGVNKVVVALCGTLVNGIYFDPEGSHASSSLKVCPDCEARASLARLAATASGSAP